MLPPQEGAQKEKSRAAGQTVVAPWENPRVCRPQILSPLSILLIYLPPRLLLDPLLLLESPLELDDEEEGRCGAL
jgi:hypothetical protein